MQAEILTGPSATQFAAELASRDQAHLPLQQRPQLAQAFGASAGWMVRVGKQGFGVQVHRSRTLPGHSVLRVRRLALDGLDREQFRIGLRALVQAARVRRTLRIHLEICTPVAAGRAAITQVAVKLGFRTQPPTSYRQTVLIDLNRSDDELLASFHATARRHIRAIRRYPVAVIALRDASLAPRMCELAVASMSRTGGSYEPQNWDSWIALARSGICEVVGMVRTDKQGPQSLISFALALNHGSVAEYAWAGSARPEDMKVPLLYAPTWQLMRWARDQGARWWDFGGITATGQDDDDPRGGIHDFKRLFSRNVADVGSEMTLGLAPIREAVAGAVGRAASVLRRSVLRATQ